MCSYFIPDFGVMDRRLSALNQVQDHNRPLRVPLFILRPERLVNCSNYTLDPFVIERSL